MKVLWSWLKELLPALEEVSVEEACEALSKQGIEVAGIKTPEFSIGEKILVGKIVHIEPLTEKLKVAKIEINYSTFTAVSGAPNLKAGVKVAVALPGSSFIDKNGDLVVAEQRTIKGVPSEAVLLSEREVGISDDHSGIWILPDELDTGFNLSELLRTWQNDYIIDLEITPNRGDALSHLGIARELKAWLIYHKQIKDAQIVQPPIAEAGKEPISVNIEIEDSEGCPRYTAIEVKGVNIGPSPMYIQRKLRLLDFNVINNVVDSANYVMLEIGHPLHTFDRKEINDDLIKVRRAHQGESFRALNDNVYTLTDEDLVIADGKRVLALAGIIGAIDTGVGLDTTEIVLESAWFKPERISRTRRRLGLDTDAAYRFERGADISITEFAARRFLNVLGSYEFVSAIQDVYASRKHPKQVFVSFDYLNKITGGFLKKEEARQLLELMDINVDEGEEGFHCTVPLYKYDVTRPADIIEEIVRLYGMDNIEVPETMNIQLVDSFEDEKFFEFRNSIINRFISYGFQEVQTLSFVEKEWVIDFFDASQLVEVHSSTIGSRSVLRPTLMFSLTEVVGRNRSNNVRINQYVEIGKTYNRNINAFNEQWVCALISHELEPLKHWNDPTRASNYWKLSAHIEKFLYHNNLIGHWQPIDIPWLECARQLIIDDIPFALMGAIPYKVRKQFGIKEHVFYGEIFIEPLWKKLSAQKHTTGLSAINENQKLIWHDISFIIPEGVPFGQFYSQFLTSCHSKLKPIYISLIDVYTGENIGKGNVSYTLRIASTSQQQIDALKNCIAELIVKSFRGTLRG